MTLKPLTRRAWLAVSMISLVLVCVFAYGVLNRQNSRLRSASSAFVQQVNQLGNILKPGERATLVFNLEDSDVNGLVYVDEYCSQDLLQAKLPNGPVIDALARISRDEQTPALAWIKDRQVVYVCHAPIHTGLNCAVHYWPLREGHLTIDVMKETMSQNAFLSLEFVTDSASKVK